MGEVALAVAGSKKLEVRISKQKSRILRNGIERHPPSNLVCEIFSRLAAYGGERELGESGDPLLHPPDARPQTLAGRLRAGSPQTLCPLHPLKLL